MAGREWHERPVRLLLVDDSPGDVRLVREALGTSGLDVDLTVLDDGAHALAFLQQRDEFADAVRPDLVLLDLDLPGSDGHEVLAGIKGDPVLRRIPVCILSSSADDADITAAYEGHANSYVTKPRDLEGFFETVALIERFWLSVAALPRVNA